MKNAMEELATAAYYIPELVKGLPGSFVIEQDELTNESANEALADVKQVLAALKEAGWKDAKKLVEVAPFSHNVMVGCFRKRINKDRSYTYITLVLTSRFGILAQFRCQKSKPR